MTADDTADLCCPTKSLKLLISSALGGSEVDLVGGMYEPFFGAALRSSPGRAG